MKQEARPTPFLVQENCYYINKINKQPIQGSSIKLVPKTHTYIHVLITLHLILQPHNPNQE